MTEKLLLLQPHPHPHQHDTHLQQNQIQHQQRQAQLHQRSRSDQILRRTLSGQRELHYDGWQDAAGKKRNASGLIVGPLAVTIRHSTTSPSWPENSNAKAEQPSPSPLSPESPQFTTSVSTQTCMFDARPLTAMLSRSVSMNDGIPRFFGNQGAQLSPALSLNILPANTAANNDSFPSHDREHLSPDSCTDMTPRSIHVNTAASHPPLAYSLETSPASSIAGSDMDGQNLPPNFGMVWEGVFRSSFPKASHFDYLKSLGLKTILTLVDDEYPESHVEFMKENGINHFQIGMPGKSEATVNIPLDKITQAVSIVLDRANHPILIHCNKGKHRTGCIVGCLRKMQCWSLPVIHDEYRLFSAPKSRATDEQVIEMWDEEQLHHVAARHGGWIPIPTLSESPPSRS